LVPKDSSQSDGGTGLQLALEIEPLLFSEDSGIQSLARRVIRTGSSRDSRPVVDRLVKILDDPKSTKRLAATRALRALGPKAATALPQLNRMLEQPNDTQLRVTAALAIDRIEDGQRAQTMLNSQIWNGLDAKSKKQLGELYNAELNVH
jgi:HEAT repeat protein